MVNADRVKRKLPSLLVDNCSNGGLNAESRAKHKKGWNKFMRTRTRLSRLKKRSPEKYNTITNKIIADLNELETAVSSGS
jgi:hypothetical protein